MAFYEMEVPKSTVECYAAQPKYTIHKAQLKMPRKISRWMKPLVSGAYSPRQGQTHIQSSVDECPHWIL